MFFAEATPKKTKRRYELKEKLGEGGMGAVWRAFDTVLEIDVAMKVLLDVHDPNALRLFYEECEKQANLAHPNIVEIRDKGVLEDGSVRTPYIVMPLLRGMTLAALIRSNKHPLSTERCFDIIMQSSRGLQAAHDAGLLHRDIKPSNLFVLEDDSVKLLDFGVAHRLDLSITIGRTGTLLYMSPEQLAMKGLTRSSDVFSLGVVCYEVLTRRQPFLASSEDGVAEAIRSHHPPLPNSFNSEVSEAVSQVVCKAMAKNPAHRFASMREFSDALRRAQYDSSFTVFEPSRFEPRLAKVRTEFEEGNLQYAQELTEELLSEGYLVDALLALDTRVKAAVKQKTIERLMESARERKQDGEYRLALQRVSEVLDLESHHIEALVLRHEIETSRTEADILEWLKLGQQHLEKLHFSHAKQAAQRVLEAQPAEERALELLAQIERREHEVQRMREQKQAAYAVALEAEARNEITAALSNMRIVLELEKQAPDPSTPAQLATYESFYNKLHAEHEAIAASYAEAKQALERGDFALVDQLCDGFLTRMPQHTLFKALKFDVEERRRRAVSQRLLEVEEAIENEADLGKRVEMLEEAVSQNPGVSEFSRLLESNRQKLSLVEGIVNRARGLETRELYGEALVQWETLETIHPNFPRLQFEIQNLRLRRQLSERMQQKSRRLAEITGAAERGDLDESLRLLEQALDNLPDDSDLLELRPHLRQQRELAVRVEQLLADGRRAMGQGNIDLGLECLRAAYDLGSKVKHARTELVEGLLIAARASQDRPREACGYLEEILTLEPGNHAATGFLRFLQEQEEHTETDEALAQAQRLRTARDLSGAMDVLNHALVRYPQSTRLKQFLQNLDASRSERRGRDLNVLRRKRLEADSISDKKQLYATAASAEQIANSYQEDEEFQAESRMLKARLQTIVDVEPASPVTAPSPVLPVKPKAFVTPPVPARRSLLIVGAACASVVFLASLGLWAAHHKSSPKAQAPPIPASPSMVSVTIDAEPSGTMIRSGGKLLGVAGSGLNVSLPAGETTLDADLPGYVSQTQQIQLVPGSGTKIQFKLVPLADVFEVTGHGEMQLDGEKALAVYDAATPITLSAGEHTLTWKDADGSSVRLHMQVDPKGARPSVAGVTGNARWP